MFIGRKEEIGTLNRLYENDSAEFVAVYGRRRVGKTSLVEHVFKGRITFRHAGISPSSDDDRNLMNDQLESFFASLIKAGASISTRPKSWLEAFLMLEKHLESVDDGSRQLVFIDELPWMDTAKSKFMQAFEWFWNSWGCFRHNLMLVVCGSVNSWILDNLINNHGGLYNRLTYEIKLLPFTLGECEEFFKANDMKFSRYDITQSYMILGGIPYYMKAINREKSIAQNIDELFFRKGARFSDEFDRLFNSIFVNPEKEKAIIRFLAKRNSGYTRSEIAENLKVSNNGGLTQSLKALMASDFIVKYIPFGLSNRECYYKLTDPFCLFYIHFFTERKKTDEFYWEQNTASPEISSWRGYAFENVCFNHIRQIKKALDILGVSSSEYAWRDADSDDGGMQIDMLINRKDNVINICEMKFYSDIFTVDRNYFCTINGRAERLLGKISKKTSVRSTLVTTFGLKRNEYSSAFTNVITLDDLFG